MASQLRIGADTSDAKKNILDLGKSVKSVGDSKIQIFSNEEKRFIKQEMNRELIAMKDNLGRNKQIIGDLVKEQRKMTTGSKEELQHRDKIVKAYRTQSKLAKQIKDTQAAQKTVGPASAMGKAGAGISKTFSKYAKILAVAGIAAGAVGVPLAISSAKQFMGGAAGRTRLTGLGVNERAPFGPERMARAGLTEQELTERRGRAVGVLGRRGGRAQSVLQQAEFERARGLEGGTMMNVAGGLRGQFGGRGAEQAQAELQASIMASGMEDAIAPYLEAMTSVLAEINENGMTNTTELIAAMGEITAQGKRTPEQLARTFTSVNESIKGSTGEANAFLQTAFARGGIGGGTIGGTRFAMETGGVLGLDQSEFTKLGFDNPELLRNMQSAGQFSGLQERAGAVMNQFRRSAGLKEGQRIGDITDPSQLQAIQNLSNKIFGTEGTGGLEAISALSQVESGDMKKEEFNKRLTDIKEGKNPQVERLDKINATIAGQTEILVGIRTNIKENVGRETAKVGNQLLRMHKDVTKAQAEQVKGGAKGLTRGLGTVAEGVDYLASGQLGSDVYDGMEYIQSGKLKKDVSEGFSSAKDWVKDLFSDEGGVDKSNMTKAVSKGGMIPMDTVKAAEEQMRGMTEAVTKGVKAGIQTQKQRAIQNNNKIDVKVIAPDGKVSNRTHK